MQQARIMICCPRQESEIQNLPGQHIFFSAACFFYRKQQRIRAGSYLYRPKTAAGFKTGQGDAEVKS